MFSLIDALRYRCLRDIHQPLDAMHVLVGPNASGKTTFLDVVGFLGDLVGVGLDDAIGRRTANYLDLFWGRQGESFELAVEARIPADRRAAMNSKYSRFDTARYEVQIGYDAATNEIGIWHEVLLLKESAAEPSEPPRQRALFPASQSTPRDTLMALKRTRGSRTLVKKTRDGNDNFDSEGSSQWAVNFKLGAHKSALGNLPDDESKFPVSTWFRRLLADQVQVFQLNSLLIRRASPPGKGRGFQPDGSNLPWVIHELELRHPGAC